MRSPDRSDEDTHRLSPEARRRVLRAAFLRPMSLLVVVVGGVFFALTLAWWAVPLTLVTYAALVFLAVRDPLFQGYVLEGRPMIRPVPSRNGGLSPEQRVGRLPVGETRRKAEEALEVQQRTIIAIRESGEETEALLHDAVPKLNQVAARLVEIAERRENLAGEIRNLETQPDASHREDRAPDPASQESEIRAAEAGISDAVEKLRPLRTRVVRVSTETSAAARETAAEINADLDEMNLRLEALRSASPSRDPSDQ